MVGYDLTVSPMTACAVLVTLTSAVADVEKVDPGEPTANTFRPAPSLCTLKRIPGKALKSAPRAVASSAERYAALTREKGAKMGTPFQIVPPFAVRSTIPMGV